MVGRFLDGLKGSEKFVLIHKKNDKIYSTTIVDEDRIRITYAESLSKDTFLFVEDEKKYYMIEGGEALWEEYTYKRYEEYVRRGYRNLLDDILKSVDPDSECTGILTTTGNIRELVIAIKEKGKRYDICCRADDGRLLSYRYDMTKDSSTLSEEFLYEYDGNIAVEIPKTPR